MQNIAATTEILCIRPDGEHLAVTIEVLLPYLAEDDLWHCQVSLRGLYPILSPMKSDDSLHALCMGLFLVRNLLLGFLDDGGRIMIAKDPHQEFPLEAYFPL